MAISCYYSISCCRLVAAWRSAAAPQCQRAQLCATHAPLVPQRRLPTTRRCPCSATSGHRAAANTAREQTLLEHWPTQLHRYLPCRSLTSTRRGWRARMCAAASTSPNRQGGRPRLLLVCSRVAAASCLVAAGRRCRMQSACGPLSSHLCACTRCRTRMCVSARLLTGAALACACCRASTRSTAAWKRALLVAPSLFTLLWFTSAQTAGHQCSVRRRQGGRGGLCPVAGAAAHVQGAGLLPVLCLGHAVNAAAAPLHVIAAAVAPACGCWCC